MTCVSIASAITRENTGEKTDLYDNVCRVRNWDCKNKKMYDGKVMTDRNGNEIEDTSWSTGTVRILDILVT